MDDRVVHGRRKDDIRLLVISNVDELCRSLELGFNTVCDNSKNEIKRVAYESEESIDAATTYIRGGEVPFSGIVVDVDMLDREVDIAQLQDELHKKAPSTPVLLYSEEGRAIGAKAQEGNIFTFSPDMNSRADESKKSQVELLQKFYKDMVEYNRLDGSERLADNNNLALELKKQLGEKIDSPVQEGVPLSVVDGGKQDMGIISAAQGLEL